MTTCYNQETPGDHVGVHTCLCTTCASTASKRDVHGAETTRFQPHYLTGKDFRMQSSTEYNDKYYEMRSGTARRLKDDRGFPTNDHYPKLLRTNYTELFDKKPIFPAKLWNPKTSHKSGETFGGNSLYSDSYKKWKSEPRGAFKPPGFTPGKAEFDERTTYTTNFKDFSKPEQPWRKAEHWPHNYSLCDVCHPTRSGPFKTSEEDVKVVNVPGADLDGRTTYTDYFYNQGPSKTRRTLQPPLWGPVVEPLDGLTTYLDKFRRPPNKDKGYVPKHAC